MMIYTTQPSSWLYRSIFILIAIAILFVKILPLDLASAKWPWPDILLCIIFCWTIRRPDYMPLWLISIVLLIEDFLLLRPPGLWPALIIIAVIFIRNRVSFTRDISFLGEWGVVSIVMMLSLLSYHLILTLMLVSQSNIGLSILQIILTILAYPFIVFISRYILGLRKPAIGQIDISGKRL